MDSKGRIYVADVLAHQILVYSADGSHLFAFGREGSGPGEFQAIASMAVYRDSLLVLDARLQRITVFSPDADEGHRLVRTASAMTARGRFAGDRLMVLSDGDLLLPFHGLAMSFGRPGDGQSIVRRLTPDAQVRRDSLLVLADQEWLISALPDGHVVEPMPFGNRSIVRLEGDTLYHGWSGSPWIAVSDARGKLVRRVRVPGQARPVKERDVNALLRSVESSREWSRGLRASRWRAAWEAGSLPDSFPMIEDFVADDSGRLWVKGVGGDEQLSYGSWGLEYAPGSDSVGILVLDTRRGTSGRMLLPSGTKVAAVQAGRMYAIARDQLGVETVVVYLIETGGQES